MMSHAIAMNFIQVELLRNKKECRIKIFASIIFHNTQITSFLALFHSLHLHLTALHLNSTMAKNTGTLVYLDIEIGDQELKATSWDL